ncbi:hypothetical protein N9966_01010 [bacterium]|nr:hypothetical protein [bacterium]
MNMKKHQRDKQGKAVKWKQSPLGRKFRTRRAFAMVRASGIVAAGIHEINIIRSSGFMGGDSVHKKIAIASSIIGTVSRLNLALDTA